MIKRISLAVVVMISVAACKKTIINPLGINPKCKSAKLVGFDARKCGCCGGFLVNIDGVVFRSQTNLAALNSDFDLDKISFPKNIALCFETTKDNCGNTVLEVKKVVME